MAATNSPFSLAGITQPTTFQGLSSFFLASDVPFRMKYPRYTEVQPTCLPIIAMTNGQTPSEVHHKPMQSGGLPCLRPPAFHIHGKWVPFSTLLRGLLPQTAFSPGQLFAFRFSILY